MNGHVGEQNEGPSEGKRLHKITVGIPAVQLRMEEGKPYSTYIIRVDIRSLSDRSQNVDWCIERRYNEFYELYKTLTTAFPVIMKGIKFPPKKVLGRFSSEFVEERRILLEQLMETLALQSDVVSRSPHFRSFLQIDKFAPDAILFVETPKPVESQVAHNAPHGTPPPVDRSSKIDLRSFEGTGRETDTDHRNPQRDSSPPPLSHDAFPGELNGIKKRHDDPLGRKSVDEGTVVAMTKSGSFVVKKPKFALTLYSFIASESRQISFNANEIILVIDSSDNNGWWQGQKLNRTGFFPMQYVILLEEPSSFKWDTVTLHQAKVQPTSYTEEDKQKQQQQQQQEKGQQQGPKDQPEIQSPSASPEKQRPSSPLPVADEAPKSRGDSWRRPSASRQPRERKVTLGSFVPPTQAPSSTSSSPPSAASPLSPRPSANPASSSSPSSTSSSPPSASSPLSPRPSATPAPSTVSTSSTSVSSPIQQEGEVPVPLVNPPPPPLPETPPPAPECVGLSWTVSESHPVMRRGHLSFEKGPARMTDWVPRFVPGIVTIDFQAESEKELSIKKGDLVFINKLDFETQWCYGWANNAIGCFPFGCVRLPAGFLKVP